MPKGREELRRGVRELIEKTSREMEALRHEGEPAPGPEAADQRDRPILRLVRDPAPPAGGVGPSGVDAAPTTGGPAAATTAPPVSAPPEHRPAVEPPAPAAPPPVAPAPTAARRPAAPLVPGAPADASGVHPSKGVCGAYYVNHACWEVPEAFCNQALHVCMLRDCPVYHLNRHELERRFAAKFSHLW